MILVPAAAERNTRIAAEEQRDSQEFRSCRILTSLHRPLKFAPRSRPKHLWLYFRVFSDAAKLNS
jgi:hypothetical protein